MAEGDTILRLARRFQESMVGEAVAAAAPNPRGKAAGIERLEGLRLQDAEARGKHLLLDFGELALHSHLGMSGGWHFYRGGARWGRPRSAAWAILSAGGWDAVQFGGPTLRVAPPGRLRHDPQLARLGPDVLDPGFDMDAAVAGMRAQPGRGLGEALLDQRLVAGIGNIFKSEACFAAGVDPWRRVGDLSERELRNVLLAASELMRRAADEGRHPHLVYRRRQGACPRCRGPVSSRGQGDDNRTTYWCPRCQA